MAVNKANMKLNNIIQIQQKVPISQPVNLQKKIEELTQQLEERNKRIEIIKKQKRKYAKSGKGRIAQKKASAKYWMKIRSGRPRGRPKKNV